MLRLLALVALLFANSLGEACHAQERTPSIRAEASLEVRGVLLSPEGQPVSGGMLCFGVLPKRMIDRIAVEFDTLDATRSSPDGSFALDIPADWLERVDPLRDLVLCAYAERQGFYISRLAPQFLPVGQTLRVDLEPLAPHEVRVLNPDGTPAQQVQLLPEQIKFGPFGQSTRIPLDFARALAATADEDGRATLPLPRARIERLCARITPTRTQHFWLAPDQNGALPSELQLTGGRELPLSPSARVAEHLRDSAAVALRISSSVFRESGQGPDVIVTSTTEVQLSGAGPPTSVWLPEGLSPRLFLWSDDIHTLTWGAFLEGEGEAEIVRLDGPQELQRFTGAVVDENGAGVEGVRLTFLGQSSGTVTSSQDGSFEFLAASTTPDIVDIEPGDGYFLPLFAVALRASAGVEKDLEVAHYPTITLRRTRSVEGLVLSPTGEPTAGAWVHGHQVATAESGAFSPRSFTAITDSEGRFQVDDVLADLQIQWTARTPEFLGSLNASPGGMPIEITLGTVQRPVGRAIDADSGRPVPGVRATLTWTQQPVWPTGALHSGGMPYAVSDDRGRFTFDGALESGRSYRLSLKSAGLESRFTDLRTENWTGLRDFEVRPLRAFTGTLKLREGKPVPGATIWIRGREARALTDEFGRFNLEGVLRGDALALAMGESIGLVGRLIPEGAGNDVDWIAAPWQVSPPGDFDQAPSQRSLEPMKRFAWEEFERAAAEGRGRVTSGLGKSLARADPAGLLARLESGDLSLGSTHDFLLGRIVEALSETSPREALSVAQRLPVDLTRVGRVLDAARHLPPAEELERLASEVASLDSIPDPGRRLYATARLAQRLRELGRGHSAAALLQRGQLLAAQLPGVEWAGYARATLGEVLCLAGEETGEVLIQSLEDGDPNRHFGNVAHLTAPTDPEASEQWLLRCGRSRGYMSIERCVSRVVHAMAPTDLERAVRLADSYDGSGFSRGVIAQALYSDGRDADEWRPHLEAAFARAAVGAKSPPVSTVGAVRAALVGIASEIDPESLPERIAWALSLDGLDPQWQGSSHGRGMEAALAFYVAHSAPEVARVLLEPYLEGADEPGQWTAWAALAAIDPEEALSRARAHSEDAALIVSGILSMTRRQQITYVQDRLLNLWSPGLFGI